MYNVAAASTVYINNSNKQYTASCAFKENEKDTHGDI